MIQTFADKTALQTASAEWLCTHLADAIARRGSAVFLASGGRTPAPIYETLSQAQLDWSSVWIGLTDERWVDEDHPASNAAMVRASLLQKEAQDAIFVPMKLPGDDAFAAVGALDELYMDANFADVMLLGMGPDAHTLSWFAGGKGYDEAVDPAASRIVAAVKAVESDVTGPNTLRMTLTYPAVAQARHILLLITGADKKHVFETADANTPVGRMRTAAGKALTVFYCE